MRYGFFDDSYTLAEKGYTGADRMSLKQFLFMGSIFFDYYCFNLNEKT